MLGELKMIQYIIRGVPPVILTACLCKMIDTYEFDIPNPIMGLILGIYVLDIWFLNPASEIYLWFAATISFWLGCKMYAIADSVMLRHSGSTIAPETTLRHSGSTIAPCSRPSETPLSKPKPRKHRKEM